MAHSTLRFRACSAFAWTLVACAPSAPPPVPTNDAPNPGEEASPASKDEATPTIVQLALGGQHSCARLSDGRVACWGDDSTGQVGLGRRAQYARPVAVPGLAGVVDLAAGDGHNCAVLRDGGVKCWGTNSSGEIGNGHNDPIESVLTPTVVVGLGDARSVRLGRSFSCALRKTGTVACWGTNRSGELGNDTKIERTTAADVAGLRDVVEIAAGSGTACARHADATVECWGESVHSPVPVPMPHLAGAEELAVGGDSLCVRLRNGKVVCDKVDPPAIENVARIAAKGLNQCAIDDGGALFCWGTNEFGQVGDGTTTERKSAPTRVALTGVVEVAIGAMYHACARTKESAVYCWGRNLYGAVGDGSKEDRATPVRIDLRYLSPP